ncbi:CDP-diacylglycerol--serine O-phosphatidyltransferase [Flavobacteriales bacterium]|nr:CDP-diacylglycerol--serine O-phosphatidyltransferase [Flavobacteriales bacterium]
MNAIKRNIPNIITLTNLFCGLCAILFSFEGNLEVSAVFIFGGALFDFFDGLMARFLKISSELGKQLDSFADLVTFGIAPGMILFQLFYFKYSNSFFQSNFQDSLFFTALIALFIPICSAIRLAKFNIDSRQKISFIGLPTPAVGVFIAALPLIEKYQDLPIFTDFKFLILISLALPLLLVANIPLFSLKFSKTENLNSRVNIFRIILIISAVNLLFFFWFAAIPFIVILYLILAILNNLIT